MPPEDPVYRPTLFSPEVVFVFFDLRHCRALDLVRKVARGESREVAENNLKTSEDGFGTQTKKEAENNSTGSPRQSIERWRV